jgi:MFS family permease
VTAGAAAGGSLWRPLRVTVFRAVWAAQMASNMAIWMHTVSAQWVLTTGGARSTLVAAVQTAMTLPFFLLALPAGVLADAFERRRVLVSMQLVAAAVSLVLAGFALTGHIDLTGVLVATLGIGAASATSIVAYQSLIPEMVDRPLLPAAATLDGMSFNAGRIVGPAFGGALLAVVAPAWVFLLNGIVFVVAALTFRRWSPVPRSTAVREKLGRAFRSGVGYVRHNPPMRRLLLRVFLWTLPASLIWALLPLIAHDELGLDSAGFGRLFASLGVGAVIGGVVLQPVRARLGVNPVLAGASLVYGTAFLVVAATDSVPVVATALGLAGASWITVLSMTMALAQTSLPPWVRARGLAIVLLVHQGCQALGALLWGVVADLLGVTQALTIAGTVLVLGGVSVRWLGLRAMGGPEPAPSPA